MLRATATVGAAAAVPSSLKGSASMARRTVDGEEKLRSGSDRLAIHATSRAISLGMSASLVGGCQGRVRIDPLVPLEPDNGPDVPRCIVVEAG